LQRERAVLSQFDEEVKALDATIKRIQEVLTDLDVEIKKTEHDIATATKDRQTSQALVAQLENKTLGSQMRRSMSKNLIDTSC
jgi:structural maintenance of chromosome 2